MRAPGRCQAAAMDLGLAGKTAFATGGSAGTGLAVARALRDEGATATVCRRAPDRLEASGLPGVRADITDPDALAQAVDEAAERMGGSTCWSPTPAARAAAACWTPPPRTGCAPVAFPCELAEAADRSVSCWPKTTCGCAKGSSAMRWHRLSETHKH